MFQLTTPIRICITVTLCFLLCASSVCALETWTALGLSSNAPKCIAVAPGNSSLLLVGGTNLYVSTNGGSTWTTIAEPSDVRTVAFGSNQNVAFAGCGNGAIYKSTDGCATWNLKTNGLTNPNVTVVRVSPTDDNTVYAAGSGNPQGGLCRSTDGGESWSRIYPLTCATVIGGLAIAPSNANTVYIEQQNVGVLKSTDGGATWSSPMTVGNTRYGTCNGIAVDPTNDNIVYAVFQAYGVWATLDGGATWKQISPTFEGWEVSVDKLRSGFVYGLGGTNTCPQRSGCYGASGWKTMNAGWASSWYARGIAIDPNDSSKVYACSTTNGGGVFQWISEIVAPNPPTNLAASAPGSGIDLTWTASSSSDCTGYWVYRTTTPTEYPPAPLAEVNGRTTTAFTDINVNSGLTYYYKLAAVDAAQNHSTLTNEANATVNGTYDLDVTYIERTPRDTYRYDIRWAAGSSQYVQPGTENQKRWPDYGQTVTFVAHIINKGSAVTPSANYRWKVNGVQVAAGNVAGIGHGQEGTASLDWVWNVNGLDTDHSDQTVTFEINYDNAFAEIYTQNNSLTDYIEAMSLIVALEPALYDALNTRVNLTGTWSAEDWLQQQMKATNLDLARSTYIPLAPNGCLERMRIDRIIVANSLATADLTTDGQWQISGGSSYADTFALIVDGGLCHEWMHTIGLNDLYLENLTSDLNRVVTPDGIPNNTDFLWGRGGIMYGGDISPHSSGSSQTMPEYLAPYDVMALNSDCGYRRGWGGDFTYDIPASNYIVVKDAAGNPAPNVTVKVFQRHSPLLPNAPVLTGVTDDSGTVLLTNRPVTRYVTTPSGHSQHDNPFGDISTRGYNANLLVEMSRPGGDFDYAWMDITQFNLAYWSGNTSSWTYTINSHLASSALPRITALNGTVQTLSGQPTRVALSWPAVPGATSYTVYRASRYLNQAADPTHQYENWVYRPIATGLTSTAYADSSIFQSSRYAVAAVDSTDNVAPLSNRFFAPWLQNVWSVGVLSDGNRVVLAPLCGPLIWQGQDGVYTATFGAVDFHLEYSKFMAIDNNLGRLIFSHPGDEYTSRHSIRVNNLNVDLVGGLLEIGSTGSGPGQFNSPRGVAVDAESRIYAMDGGNNRIQMFTSAGAFICQFGSAGSGSGQFNNAQGIAVDSKHRIYVCDQGNARVQILQFDTGTNSISFLGTLTGRTFVSPMAVTIGPADNVFVTDCSATRNSVEAFSSYGNWLHTYTQANGVYTGALNYPSGVAVDNNGSLVVCDTNNKRVVTILAAQPITAGAARTMTDGRTEQLEGEVVTAKFSGYFYVQDRSGIPGIRVVSSAAVSVGQMVDIYGSVATTNGEREILASVVAAHQMATSPPAPEGMNLRAMGGSPNDPVPGIDGSTGLNNVGLLMKTFGTTSARNPANNEFYISDGSGSPIRVYAPGLTVPADGSSVAVTGVSGAELSGGKVVRVLRARSIQ